MGSPRELFRIARAEQEQPHANTRAPALSIHPLSERSGRGTRAPSTDDGVSAHEADAEAEAKAEAHAAPRTATPWYGQETTDCRESVARGSWPRSTCAVGTRRLEPRGARPRSS